MRKKTAFLILFTILFVSTLSVAVSVPLVKAWSGTIYIYSDGSVFPSSAPIHQNSDVYTLTDNVITTGDGIVIERNSTTFDGNGYSIQGSSSGNGIDLTGTIYVTVKNTNLQGFSIGIFAPSSDYDTISRNTISQNSVSGIWLDSSSNNNIIGNNMQQNGAYGIWLSSSSNNTIYHNNLVNNAVQVYTTYDSINTWDNGYPLGGNYWSDYVGTDSNKDGIGDTSYTIDSNNIDNYPLTNLWKLGDATYDGKVNVLDLIAVAIALGTHPGDLKWNPRADVTQDGVINVLDLIAVASHLGT